MEMEGMELGPEGKKEWPEQRAGGMDKWGIFVIPGERT